MARKKGGSGAKNGRDSQGQRLGVKAYGGEVVTSGSIIIRQRGTKIHPGLHVGKGTDDTLFAMADGTVVFNEHHGKRFASIEPSADWKPVVKAKKAKPVAAEAPAVEKAEKAPKAEKAAKKPAAEKPAKAPAKPKAPKAEKPATPKAPKAAKSAE